MREALALNFMHWPVVDSRVRHHGDITTRYLEEYHHRLQQQQPEEVFEETDDEGLSAHADGEVNADQQMNDGQDGNQHQEEEAPDWGGNEDDEETSSEEEENDEETSAHAESDNASIASSDKERIRLKSRMDVVQGGTKIIGVNAQREVFAHQAVWSLRFEGKPHPWLPYPSGFYQDDRTYLWDMGLAWELQKLCQMPWECKALKYEYKDDRENGRNHGPVEQKDPSLAPQLAHWKIGSNIFQFACITSPWPT